MSFSPQFLDELRARVSLADLVGRRVRLKQRRPGDFWGLSPFQSEKTPSFHVVEDKGFYKCFTTGNSGDAIKWLMEVDGLGFREAVEQLAEIAGLETPRENPKDRARREKAQSLLGVLEGAARFFAAQLGQAAGSEARAYLTRRGLTENTIATFQIGYAPEARGLLAAALQQTGAAPEQMDEAGLIAPPDTPDKPPYERFRGRIIFPIADRRGRTIAFGGRALSPDARAKYLNSPETPLFHKGATLFNLHRAREPARQAGTVLVAEGYMDVVALHQAGFQHVVAPLGTALTADQVRMLWGLAREPILCLDGDRAGRGGAARVAELSLALLKPGHSLRFAFLPEGEDPDSLIHASGPAAFQACLDAALPLAEMVWRNATEGRALDTPERRAALSADLWTLVGAISDKGVRAEYERYVKQRLGGLFSDPKSGHEAGGADLIRLVRRAYATGFKDGRRGLWRLEDRYRHLFNGAALRTDAAEGLFIVERGLLAAALNYPELFWDDHEEVLRVSFLRREHRRLVQFLLALAPEGDPPDAATLQALTRTRGLGDILDRLLTSATFRLMGFARPGAGAAETRPAWRHYLAQLTQKTWEREQRDQEARTAAQTYFERAEQDPDAAFSGLLAAYPELAGAISRDAYESGYYGEDRWDG